jgi:dihydroorotase
MPGVETLFPLMLSRALEGLCTLPDLTRWMSEGPARLYGMVNKGRIAPGYDADFVLVDTASSHTIRNGHLQTRVNWSPYDGWTLKGKAKITIVRGKIVHNEGTFNEPGWGRPLRFETAWEKGAR